MALCCLLPLFRCALSDPSGCASGCIFGCCVPDGPAFKDEEKELPKLRKQADEMYKLGISKPEWFSDILHEDFKTQNDVGGELQLRLYRHKSIDAEHPADVIIVYLHGGSWMVGSVEGYGPWCSALASALSPKFDSDSPVRAAVLYVEYRRAPDEATFPHNVGDCYRALLWAFNEGKARVGTDKIVIMGDSAGGNLTGAVTRLARDRNNFPPVLAQIPLCPAITPDAVDDPSRYGKKHMVKRESMRFAWAQYLASKANYHNEYASLLHKGVEGLNLPPTFVALAGDDSVLKEGQDYVDKLKMSPTHVQSKVYPKRHHNFFMFLDLDSRGSELLTDIRGFIHAILNDKQLGRRLQDIRMEHNRSDSDLSEFSTNYSTSVPAGPVIIRPELRNGLAGFTRSPREIPGLSVGVMPHTLEVVPQTPHGSIAAPPSVPKHRT